MPKKSEIVLSDDGSHSVLSSKFHTTYHSTHGALTESSVVFIDAGLNFQKEKGYKRLSVFEMGFGTGLNALLAKLWSDKNKFSIDFFTVEAFPIEREIIDSLNYGELVENTTDLLEIHDCSWERKHQLSDFFSISKFQTKIEDLGIEDKFDVVFYDAFGPGVQPELWESDILGKIYNILNPGAVLTTFCAQGAFKRNLKSVGFEVYRLPGPPGKREMTRAIKIG